MKKTGRILSNVLLVVLAILVLLLVAPRIFGIKLYSVLSGSMEPAYSVGDLIYVFPTDAAKLEVGDVVTFVMNDQGTIATHRIVEVDAANQSVFTKGDANEVADGRSVSFANIVGVVRFSIPVLGYLIAYMNTGAGRVITITIILALILLVMLLQFATDDGDEEAAADGAKPTRAQKKAAKAAAAQAATVQKAQVAAAQTAAQNAQKAQQEAEQMRAAAARQAQTNAQIAAAKQAEATARAAAARQAAQQQAATVKGAPVAAKAAAGVATPGTPQTKQNLMELLSRGYYTHELRYHPVHAPQWHQLIAFEKGGMS